MAFLSTLDTKVSDGGLSEAIIKIGLLDEVKKWVFGEGEKDLMCEHLTDFFTLWSGSSWEAAIKSRLKAADLPNIGTEGRIFDKQTSRLRQLYLLVKHNMDILESHSKPGAAPMTDAQLEAKLDDATDKDLKARWKSIYGITIKANAAACDTLLGRTHREWSRNIATVPELSKVRSQAASVLPNKMSKTRISDTYFFTSEEPAETKIESIVEHYLALKVLMHCWAFVGNFDDPAEHGKLFIHYDEAFGYAEDALRWTLESGLPDHLKLKFMKNNDIATRTRMMELMRQGESAGTALAHALEHTKAEWRPVRQDLRALAGRDRSRSRPGGKSKGKGRDRGGKGGKNTDIDANARPNLGQGSRTVTTGSGNKELCWRYNVGRCNNEKQCPDRSWHLCDFRMPNGKACQAKHMRESHH